MKKDKKSNKRSLYLRLCSGCAVLSLIGAMSIGDGARVSAAGHLGHTDSYTGYSAAPAAYNANVTESRVGKIHYNLPGIPSRNLWSYDQINLTLNGRSVGAGAIRINGITYLPLKEVTDAIGGATLKYSSDTKTVTLTMPSLLLSATDGGYVIYANDRPLFSFSPSVKMSNGRMYLPASALCKALGLSIEEKSGSVSLRGTYRALTPASKFYREDEVYWLSKIISAEAAGETLLGQIAVGDVIMNRVYSTQYPNTIYGVIFDRKYGVQFSPTADGRIYGTPTYTATLASKIILEGVSLTDDAMFFLNPGVAESNWITKNREYAYTIGNHDFYK